MYNAADNRTNFKYTARPRLPVVGEAILAATWLLVIGLLNLFYAISVLADSHIFITTAAWLVGDTRPYGWLMLIVSLIQLAAAPGVLLAKPPAVYIGMLSVIGHVAAAIMFLSDEPGIAIALLILDLVVFACMASLVRSRVAVAA